ncbi:MAG TPA: glycosyltransferase [Bacteroidales bacterium]|nr:glycosyltransferase [Bacteroidales bacterium]
MRITFLGPAYPYRGGLAAFNERLAREFSSEGKDTDIRTFRLQYPKFLFPGKTQYSDSPPPEGIRIIRLLSSINPLNWIITGFKIKRERPDILIIRYWIPFMAPCLGTVARIVRSNNYTVIISILDNIIPHEKRTGDKILTKYFIRSIDGAVVLSNTVLYDLKLFRKDFPVNHNPHPLFDNYGKIIRKNEALSALNLDPGCSYLLFFGFIREYKGLDLLIKAFSDQRLRNRNLKLIVAGEFYENDTPYKKLIKEYNLENDILIYDHFIKDSEVALFFSAADLVVQPYKSATQSGITQIAFHFEKPVLVTDVGGLKEVVQDGKSGYVVNPVPEDIATAIADFYDNNREASFTKGIKQEKEKYSWNKMTASVIEVFYKCLLEQLIKAM